MSTTLTALAIIKAVDKFSPVMSKISASVGQAYARMDKTVQKSARKSRRIGHDATGPGGLGASAAGGTILKNAYTFDKALKMIQAQSGSSEKQMARLRTRIVELAQKYPKTRAEIARGALEFVTAGNAIERVRNNLDLLVKGALASQQEVGRTGADVTDIVAAMYGHVPDEDLFKKRVTDSLNAMAVSASEANHKWGEMVLAMQYSTPVARAFGIPLENLTAMIGVLADNGFKGEKGGSALRTMLLNLRSPTARAREAFSKLGIDMEKAFKFNSKKAFGSKGLLDHLQLNFGKQEDNVAQIVSKTLANSALQSDVGKMRNVLIERLSKAMNIKPGQILEKEKLARALDRHFQSAVENMDLNYMFNKLEKADAGQIFDVFGVRRTPQAISLARGWQDQYKTKLERIQNNVIGAMDKRMGIFLKGFAADIDRLVSALDSLSDAIEQSGILKTVSAIAEKLRDMAISLSKSSPEFLNFGAHVLLGAAALAPLGFVMAGVASAFSGFWAILGAGLVLFKRLSLWTIPLIWGGKAIYENWDSVSGTFDKVWTSVSKNWEGSELKKFASYLGGEFSKSWEGVKSLAEWLGKLAGLDFSSDGIAEWFGSVDKWVQRLLNPVRTLGNALARLKNWFSKTGGATNLAAIESSQMGVSGPSVPTIQPPPKMISDVIPSPQPAQPGNGLQMPGTITGGVKAELLGEAAVSLGIKLEASKDLQAQINSIMSHGSGHLAKPNVGVSNADAGGN